MKKVLHLLLGIFLHGCATTTKVENTNLKLRYLDDMVIPNNLTVEGTKVGGLSGIDYHNGTYYLVCDHPSHPRFYKARIALRNRAIDTVLISEVVHLDKEKAFFEAHTPDMEGIRFDAENKELAIAAEGAIDKGKAPSLFRISPEGKLIGHYKIPDYFKPSKEQKPRNNGVFEGLAESFDKKSYWVATELPLEKDGSKPKIYKTKSPVRITKFNKSSQMAEKQFTYQLDGIAKLPINWFAVNGVTEILAYADDRFLVLERSFSAGYGSNGNTVKIFDVDASKATNTLEMENLSNEDFRTAKKRLIFNFKTIKNFLTKETIDNIEGMSFGPNLPNGKKSLILVSDDNFSSFNEQITQFILLELEINNP